MGEWGAEAPFEPAPWQLQPQNQETWGPGGSGRVLPVPGCALPLRPLGLGRGWCAPETSASPLTWLHFSIFQITARASRSSPDCSSPFVVPLLCPGPSIIFGDIFLSYWAVYPKDRP